jgi:TolA-binding protein
MIAEQHSRARLEDISMEKEKNTPQNSSSETPSESEAFAGNEIKSLQTSPIPVKNERLSTIQKIILLSIILIAAALLSAYMLLKTSSASSKNNLIANKPPTFNTPADSNKQPPTSQPVSEGTQPSSTQQMQSQPELPPAQPTSLKTAQNFFAQQDYNNAYTAYNQLYQLFSINPDEKLITDYLQLKMAICLKKSGDIEQAGNLLKTVIQSRSPVTRVIANYYLGSIETQKKQYLKARTRAYQTIALIDTIDIEEPWVVSLQNDCYYLIAETMTRNILSFGDSDKDLPKDIWSDNLQIDPFTDITEEQLRHILNSGTETLSKAMLSPQILKEPSHGSTTDNWSITCHGASIEELLTRFAANIQTDVFWTLGDDSTGIRKRMISLYIKTASPLQIITVAAGSAGLLANIDDEKIINISNPDDYSSSSQHLSLLTDEAIFIWQKFLLASPNNNKVANAHFALGLLYTQKKQITTALAEYKLVANRFSQLPIAPFALLHSSKIKVNLLDYSGARQDLKQLIEQYPDAEIADQACLYLADSTANTGFKEEAAKLYRKVYNLSFSPESQTTAAFGAGKCFYDINDCNSAAKWFVRYVENCPDKTSTNKNLSVAYALLGKCYMALGKKPQACNAFKLALDGKLSSKQYVETVSELVKGYMDQELFVEAIETLENINLWQFSDKETIEILILKSKLLRTIGLPAKAVIILADKIDYISDAQLKAQTSLELINCYIAKGDLERAYITLTEILAVVEPGPLAYEIALTLADVCLRLNRNAQAYSICSQLLDLNPPEQIKQQALDIISSVYKQKKDYDKAALALLGQWK